MAELAYAHVSEACGSNPVEVQILSCPPVKYKTLYTFELPSAVLKILKKSILKIFLFINKTRGSVRSGPEVVRKKNSEDGGGLQAALGDEEHRGQNGRCIYSRSDIV